MRRSRFIPFVFLTLALLALPARLLAQEAAKKDATPPPASAAAPGGVAPAPEKEFQYFGFTTDPAYGLMEEIALWVVLGIAIAGLVYALGLVNQVVGVLASVAHREPPEAHS